jgi:phosphatidate cytidylyltransferase
MWLGGWWFFAVALSLAVIGALEFCNLGRNRQIQARAPLAVAATVVIVLAFVLRWTWAVVPALLAAFCLALVWSLIMRRTPRAALLDALMTIAAPAYVALPAGMLAQIRLIEPGGLHWLLLIVFLTWGTDSLAYFGGRTWGKTLLAPRISPKKTLEGALVGVSGGFVVGLVLLLIAGAFQPALLPALLIAPLVAVIGDLSESALKRTFDVKDSHLSHFDLFPGHGGVLDRTDALILVTWFCFFVYHLIGILA